MTTSLYIEVIRHGPDVGGLHQAGLIMASALRELGHTVLESELPASERRLRAAALPGVDLRVACVNADQFFRVAPSPTVPLVGWWAWEVDLFRPAFVRAATATSAVWTLSQHASTALAAALGRPVPVVPLPVLERRELLVQEPSRFDVLVMADHASGSARKNVASSLRAYLAAFDPDEGAALVVKTSGGASHPGAARRLRALADGRPDVTLLDERLPRDTLWELVQHSDVLLSLHRAEGYGLSLAESMSVGAAVITTAHGGPLDFTGDDDSVLVPAELVRVGPGHWPYPAAAKWARPDEAFAARALRSLKDDPGLRRRIGQRAALRMRERQGLSAMLPQLRRAVDEAMRLGPTGRMASAPRVTRSPARVLAGVLHRADVASRGAWAVPIETADKRRIRQLAAQGRAT